MNYVADEQQLAVKRWQRRPRGGALLLAAAGFASLSIGDAIVKSMSGEWPAPAVGALRYSIGAVALALILAARHGRRAFALPQPWLQFGRGVAVSLATLCFFIAVMHMPLADATAIQFTSPLLTALLAAFFLRERVGFVIWTAIGLAFAGVLLVLRPNVLELGATALLPAGTALGMAVLIMLNRKAAGSAPALLMQFLFAAMAAPLLILAAALFALIDPGRFSVPVPSALVLAKCAAVAVTGTAGHLLIYSATERAGASTVAPMIYMQLLVAVVVGWTWFGDAPRPLGIAGALLITAAGLLVWRVRKRADKWRTRQGLNLRPEA